jgi:E3 ubiquitin-protein ligase SIAH1
VFERHSICLYDGFNFLLADCAEDDNHGSTTTTICSSKYLFLLNVTRQSLGRAISVHLIGQGSPSEILRCVLSYSLVVYDPCERHKFLASHSLQSDINVECMDLSNGLPDPADCFHFVVPDSVLGDKNKEDPIQVNVCISIINLQ